MQYKLQITNLRALKLNVENKGLQEYFTELMDEIEERPFGTLLIDYEMDENVGGLYGNQLEIDSITLPSRDAVYNKDMHMLTLGADAIRTLIHEGSHFRHIAVDNGMFSSGRYREAEAIQKGVPLTDAARYACEYEAGVRSIGTAIMYDMGNEDEIAADNLRNLIAFRKNQFEWYNTASELYAQTHSIIFRRLITDFMLQVCKRYMVDKSFADVHDIDSINIELTPHENVILHFIALTVNAA